MNIKKEISDIILIFTDKENAFTDREEMLNQIVELIEKFNKDAWERGRLGKKQEIKGDWKKYG